MQPATRNFSLFLFKTLFLTTSFALVSACGGGGGSGDSSSGGNTDNTPANTPTNKAAYAKSCERGPSLYSSKDDFNRIATGLYRAEDDKGKLESCTKVISAVGGFKTYMYSKTDASIIMVESFMDSTVAKDPKLRFALQNLAHSGLSIEEINEAQYKQGTSAKAIMKMSSFTYQNADLENPMMTMHTRIERNGDTLTWYSYHKVVIKIEGRKPMTNVKYQKLVTKISNVPAIQYEAELQANNTLKVKTFDSDKSNVLSTSIMYKLK